MDIIGTVITQTELNFLFGLILSILAGFIMGLEREARGKDAGISTHILVVIGSMLFTFLSALVDPMSTSRIAAQVVVGIGFLGGGLILREGTTVRNLTTAASLWVAAAIGMAFGYGFYMVGLFTTIIGVLIPRIPHMMQTDVKEEEHHR